MPANFARAATAGSPLATAKRQTVDRRSTRRMRLTRELVARVARDVEDPGPAPGRSYAVDADYEATARALLAAGPASGEVWVFAYGSLIWKPACDIVDQRVATLRGWHRAFCLGWDRRFRGSDEQPGLMLALDRGGTCKGVAQRLPPDAVDANLGKLLRREMQTRPSPFPPRWVSIATAAGPLRAITFAIDRNSDAYVAGLSAEEIADVLAVAVGHWGSMAEYLHNTVEHLEELGIDDRFLWRLQELVAERIEAATRPQRNSTPTARDALRHDYRHSST
jgi:glutathione-specific gamma-glutamylcyclotransferase